MTTPLNMTAVLPGLIVLAVAVVVVAGVRMFRLRATHRTQRAEEARRQRLRDAHVRAHSRTDTCPFCEAGEPHPMEVWFDTGITYAEFMARYPDLPPAFWESPPFRDHPILEFASAAAAREAASS